MNLGPEQFADFYEAVNGYPPFPWQKRLVTEVVAHGGQWPAVLDLPTSAGKTSALDAAVFFLALQVTEENGQFKPIPVQGSKSEGRIRTAAVRTFFVVDRRIVVDEAAEKAWNLARFLNAADGKPGMAERLQVVARKQRGIQPENPNPLAPDDIAQIRRVAERLEAFGGEKALHVSVLRGGMYRDGSWAESPTQPTICLSTVDQVGSRLLFRGYGVGPNQRAVHAGLVGNDALILVDEAHLSRPFIETLKAVEFYRSPAWAEKGHHVRTPFQVCVMSATAGDATADVGPTADEGAKRPAKLELDAEDRANETLKSRLGASKRARLEEVKGGAEDEEANRQSFADKLAEFARELATPSAPVKVKRGTVAPPVVTEANVIGVIVNRVDTARRVHRALATDPTFAAILLTGRIRPYDRDRLLAEWFPYMEAKRGRPAVPDGRTLFVVATQTVEVGANLSFDAIVSEAAPLDALRQRFGRLDRLGLRGNSDAVIVTRKDLLRKDDRVYGDRVKATWDWLAKTTSGSVKNKRIDFGIDAFDALLPPDADERRKLLDDLSAHTKHAPVLMPAHVDDLVQTSVPPVPDPSVELFLHGPQSGPADVSVVWRADITETQLAAAADKNDRDRAETEKEVVATVALVPPVSMETLPVPIWVVQKWLATDQPEDVSDIEGEADPESEGRRPKHRAGRPFLRWRGPDAEDGTEVDTTPRPGDTIIVPSTYGGCDRFGWNPTCPDPVEDVADDCSWRAKRRPVLRVHPASQVHAVALTAWGVGPDADGRTPTAVLTAAVTPDEDTGTVPPRAIRTAIASLSDLPTLLVNGLREPRGKSRGRELPYPDGSGRVLILPVQQPVRDDPPAEGDGPADDDGNSFLECDGRIPLADHCHGVQQWVERFADQLGLTAYRDVLSRAALLHDAGKADPRFQMWLYGSEAETARNGFGLIAKSDTDGRNAAAVEAARRRAGWPKHARHEAMSVLLVRSDSAATHGVADPNLMVHLIGTHHGRGRPLWPITLDDGLPAGAEPPDRVECLLNGFSLSAAGPPRPETALTPFHAGWVDDFWRMVARYGHWGLAYLELLLVLADHRRSQAETEGE